MSKQLRLDVAQLTDVGRKRPHNEDNMAYVIPKDVQAMARKGALFIVADGMGGHAAGEVASEIAVDTVSKVYYQDDSDDITVSLLHAIKRANALIHQRAAENMLRSGMGTTCVAAVLRGSMAYIANVGDSRAYLVRGGQVRQVSQDHSWVEEQVRAGLLTRDQARSHAQRNVITRCLGTQSDVEVDVFSEQLEEGDSLVLCSDGLSGLVGDEELRSIVDQYVPQESVYHLVERANENGGPDNITAIVIRVQELGWDPPGAKRPVHVGGREVANETTVALGALQGPLVNMPARVEDNHVATPGTPLRISSGPLLSPESFTAAPRAALAPSRQAQNRLFYPTVVLLVLLIVMIVGGGAYYFLRHGLFGQSVDVDNTLNQASFLIDQAKTEVANNPSLALKKLSDAQKDLRTAQGVSLSSSQQAKLNGLQQNDFAPTVKIAITYYNQQAGITALPCVNTTTTATVNSGSTNTQAADIAVVQDQKGQNVSYVLGDDHNIYQLDSNHSLVNKLMLAGTPQVQAIAADPQNQRVLALTTQPPKGTTPATFGLSLLAPQPSGELKDVNDASIDQTFTKNGEVPMLISAWGGDVYVVLSLTNGQGNEATILDFPINGDKLQAPHPSKISITTALVSMTAFPNHQLFLMYKDGSVQSLQISAGNQAPPVSVVVQTPIPAPLATTPRDFSANVTVPLPPDQPSSLSSFLAVTGGTALLSGMVDNVPHLYIVDDMYHRIIDLRVVATTAATGTPTTTPATPTPTTNAAGGGVATVTGTPVTMQVVQQYASANVLSFVRGAAVDPKVPLLYLLTKLGPTATTVSQVNIDVSQKTACQP